MEQQLSSLIQSLASQLGTTSEYLFGVLIKQAPIFGVTHLALLLILPFVVYFFYKKAIFYYENNDNYLPFVFSIIIAGLLGLLFFANLCMLPNIVTAFFNPEYWALNHILDKIKE